MKRDSFVEYVLDQLSGPGDLHARAMFGGHGLYRGDTFFAIVYDGRLYLKTDAATAGRYVEQGMGPLRVSEKQVLGSYYEVPAGVLDGRPVLAAWADEALACARAVSKALPKSKGRTRGR